VEKGTSLGNGADKPKGGVMDKKMTISLTVALSFLLAGCMTTGIEYLNLGDGTAIRVVEIGNANALEPGYNITMLGRCKADMVVTSKSYEIEDEYTGEIETVTETAETLVTSDCKDFQVDRTATNGFLPGFVNSAIRTTGVALAGYFVGDGIKNKKADKTNVSQSASGNAASGSSSGSSSESSSESNVEAEVEVEVEVDVEVEIEGGCQGNCD